MTAVAEAGGLVGAWPCGITSRSLADFGTEIIRLTEVASPDHVAIGTDLDGNYRPVLTSYDQLDDLASLLRDRGLPAARVEQILGGNALNLLDSILHRAGRRGNSQDQSRSKARNACLETGIQSQPQTGDPPVTAAGEPTSPASGAVTG